MLAQWLRLQIPLEGILMKASPNEMSKFIDCGLFFDICTYLVSMSIYMVKLDRSRFVWLKALNTGIIGSNC